MAINNIITKFLGKIIYENIWIQIDYWMIVHAISSILLIIILSLFIKKFLTKLGVLFILLVLWEGFEFILYGILEPPLISFETTINVIWDVLIGFLAGLLTALVLLFKKKD